MIEIDGTFQSYGRYSGPSYIGVWGQDIYMIEPMITIHIDPDGDINKFVRDNINGSSKRFPDIDQIPKMSSEEKILEKWLDDNEWNHKNPPPRKLIEAAFPKLDVEEVDYLIRKPDRIYERFTEEHEEEPLK